MRTATVITILLAALLLAACNTMRAPYPIPEEDRPYETIAGNEEKPAEETDPIPPKENNEPYWVDESWYEYSQKYDIFENRVGIRLATPELLQSFEVIQKINARQELEGAYVLIWAIEPLYDFQLATVEGVNCNIFHDFFYVQDEIKFTIDVLQPGQAIVINGNMHFRSWHPIYGISFLDGGQRRYVAFLPDMSGYLAPYTMAEFNLAHGRPPMGAPPPQDLREVIYQLPQWQQAYITIMQNYIGKPPPPESGWLYHAYRVFMPYDIDKDGIPELLIFFLAAGLNPESIYTFRDGELQRIYGGFLIYHYQAYANPNGTDGILAINTMRHPSVPDHVSYRLKTIEDNRLVTTVHLVQAWEDWYHWWEGEEVLRESGWFLNGEPITESEFDEIYRRVFYGWDVYSPLHFTSQTDLNELILEWVLQ